MDTWLMSAMKTTKQCDVMLKYEIISNEMIAKGSLLAI